MRVAVVLSAVVLGITACGGSGRDDKPVSSDAILSDVASALRETRGMHFDGRFVDADGRARMRFDVDVKGNVDAVLDQGGRMRMRLVNGDAWIRGDKRFWTANAGAQAAQLFADHWVHAQELAAELVDDIEELTPKGLARCLVTGNGTVSVRGREMLDGKPVIVLEDAGDKPGTSPGLLYVAAEGKPLPLRVRQTGPTRPGDAANDACAGDEEEDTTTSGDARLRFDDNIEIRPIRDAIELPGGTLGQAA